MSQTTVASSSTDQPTQEALKALYQHLIDAWNNRDAAAFAELFVDDAYLVGFDGS